MIKRLLRLAGLAESRGFRWYMRGVPDAAIGPFGKEEYLEPLIEQPGELFVDIGANVGRWTLPASRFYKRVLAFEPVPLTCWVLRRNISLNKIRNVSIFEKAVSDKDGFLDLWVPREKFSSMYSTDRFLDKFSDTTVRVKCVALDNLALVPDFVKIDVEGHEVSVLKGMMKTLEVTGRIIVECHTMTGLSECLRILKDHNFAVRSLDWLSNAYVYGEKIARSTR